jgi:hypothetical protein
MIRQTVLALLAFALMSALVGADDPPTPDQPELPVRLKKKNRPKAEAPAPDQGPSEPKPPKERRAEEPVPAPPDLERDIAEALNRLSRNMQQSAKRLNAKDPGEPTQQVQRTILKDLDALIEQAQRPNQPPDSGGSARQAPPKPGQRDQQQRNSSAAKKRPGQQHAARSGKPRQGPPSSPGKPPQGGGAANADRRRDLEPPNKLADLYKDIWGHLPESLRLEMDQYAREQFMAKYNELLKQYYATIAEKGRRKGE